MKSDKRSTGYLALAALLAAGAAEAAILCGDSECDWVILSGDSCQAITEEPDVLGAWEGYTEQRGEPLNPDGDARGDGPTELTIDPSTGLPAAVWAYNVGQNYEVAYAAWNGSGWFGPQFVTANAINDLDPAIAVDESGRAHVTWWRTDGQVHVIYNSVRDPRSGLFGFEEPFAQNGRRPSVIFFLDRLFVAFERPLPEGGQAVVVQRRRSGSLVREDVVATTRRGLPLNLRLANVGGRIRLTWTHATGQIGYTEYHNGYWDVPPLLLESGGTVRSGARHVVDFGPGY